MPTALPLYTIKPSGRGFILSGPALPDGFWHETARMATRHARSVLHEQGARVEVYGLAGQLFKTVIVQPDGRRDVFGCSSGIRPAPETAPPPPA